MRPRLPKVNADVFPLLFGNNFGWVIYASLNHNPYMFAACFPNVMLGMFYILTGYLLSSSAAARRRIEVMTLTMLGMWVALGFAVMQTTDEALRNTVIGNTGMVTMLLLFASPLSTIATIVRVKSAASINLPFALLQVLTSSTVSLPARAVFNSKLTNLYLNLRIAGNPNEAEPEMLGPSSSVSRPPVSATLEALHFEETCRAYSPKP